MKNLRITTRVEESDRQKIEELIRAGKFKNLSEVFRTGLQEVLNSAA